MSRNQDRSRFQVSPSRFKERTETIPGWVKLRDTIVKRDEGLCRICQRTDKLNVHHIDWRRGNNDPANLVTLCTRCHAAIHAEGYRPADHPDWPAPWGHIPACDEWLEPA